MSGYSDILPVLWIHGSR